MCSNKGDNSEFIFARIMLLFGLGIYSEILSFKFKRVQRPYI